MVKDAAFVTKAESTTGIPGISCANLGSDPAYRIPEPSRNYGSLGGMVLQQPLALGASTDGPEKEKEAREHCNRHIAMASGQGIF